MSDLDSNEQTAAQTAAHTAEVPQQRTPAAPPPAAPPPPDVVREFQLVHDAMRHAVRLLADATGRVQPGASPHATELGRYTGCLLDFVHHHHTGEDDHWWPALQASTDAAGTVLSPLTDDHHQLDPLIEALRGHAAALRAGTHDVAAVRRDAGALRDHLLAHLEAEEPVLFPLLADHLSPAEAERLGKVMAGSAPRKGLSYLLGAMDAAATPEQQQVILSKMPLPIRLLRPWMLRTYRRKVAVLLRG